MVRLSAPYGLGHRKDSIHSGAVQIQTNIEGREKDFISPETNKVSNVAVIVENDCIFGHVLQEPSESGGVLRYIQKFSGLKF